MEYALGNQEAAIVAAAQASEATTELLRFAREGMHSERHAFDIETDVVCKLAEALKLSMEIEGDPKADTHLDEDEIALLTNLRTALTAFLEGWVG